MVLVPDGHLDDRSAQDWDALQARARAAVLHRLAASAGMEDLKQHLKFEIASRPATGQAGTTWQKGQHLA